MPQFTTSATPNTVEAIDDLTVNPLRIKIYFTNEDDLATMRVDTDCSEVPEGLPLYPHDSVIMKKDEGDDTEQQWYVSCNRASCVLQWTERLKPNPRTDP